MTKNLEILYQDPWLVAIHKPAGLLVHRTFLAPQETEFALQILRNQLNQWVFPIHRLDKATSGVLLFGLSNESATEFGKMISNHELKKVYLAIVRGWMSDRTTDYPIPQGRKRERKPAITYFAQIDQTELPHPVGPFESARYSLIRALPVTGRRHQIRRHLKHESYPIAGDRLYGDRAHNRFFREQLELSQLFLHATKIEFLHPFSDEEVTIECPLPLHWDIGLNRLGLSLDE